MDLSEKLIELRIATRGATMCESVGGKAKNTLSLKTKILFLLKDKSLPPLDLMTTLHLAKTNLALMTSEMARENLIVKERPSHDKRAIYYSITDEGKKYLDARLNTIEESLKKSFSQKEYDAALKTLDKAIGILSFI